MMNKSEKNRNTISLAELGYNTKNEEYRNNNNLTDFEVGRVITEHKERYIVRTSTGVLEAEVLGSLRYTATSRLDFPAVGDWVAISTYDGNKAFIHHVYERKSMLLRKSVGKYVEQQIIAANIDIAFIVQAVNRDFNINRVERYLTISYESNIEPVIIITKTDLIPENLLRDIVGKIKDRISNVKIIPLSNLNKVGIDQLRNFIKRGYTYCMLGSSGVGKSTLINNLIGKEILYTKTIGEGTDRGRHATTHRELIVLPDGGIFIDNPGMRELGVTDVGSGLEQTFDLITDKAPYCKYSDCSHQHENGCAVINAVENGEIQEEYYANYLKLIREKEHYESTVLDKKRKDKDLAKLIKNVKRIKNQ